MDFFVCLFVLVSVGVQKFLMHGDGMFPCFLTFTALWANLSDDKLTIFLFYFSQNIGFDILCRLSCLEKKNQNNFC